MNKNDFNTLKTFIVDNCIVQIKNGNCINKDNLHGKQSLINAILDFEKNMNYELLYSKLRFNAQHLIHIFAILERIQIEE